MKSSGTAEFWKLYRELPEPIRQATKRTYRLWKENPRAVGVTFQEGARFIRFGLERPVIAQSRRMCQMDFCGSGSGRTTNTSELLRDDPFVLPNE